MKMNFVCCGCGKYLRLPVAVLAAVTQILRKSPSSGTCILAGLLCSLLIVFAATVFAGNTWARSEHVHELPIATVVDVNLAAGGTVEFTLPVISGTTYTLELASASHASVLVTDSG